MIVVAAILGALVLLGLALVVVYMAIHDTLRRVLKALNPAWLWFSGLPIGDGKSRTNAGWLVRSHGPKPVFHESGRAIWFHHQPRLLRAAIRTGGSVMSLGILAGLVVATQVTLIILTVLFLAGLGLAGWWLWRKARNWRHNRHYVKPLEGTIVRKIPIAPSSIDVQRDGDIVKAVDIKWPAETELDAADQIATLQAVTARLPIEAPNAAWKLKGRDRSVRFTPCEKPPPSDVSWDDVAAAVAAAGARELVFGLGKKNATVKASYGESPHLGIPGGSGGGKSNTIAFLALQELMRGTLIIILDPKGDSHAWAINLPNVIYAVEPEHIHMCLAWLGKERKRRASNAYLSAARDGIIRALPGVRLVVICEELNIGMPELKALWTAIRSKGDPKESPAIAGLRQVACAGRSCDIHAWLAAQMFNVESTGVKDSAIRSQTGIKAMLRWDAPGWNMAVGKDVPMPPRTSTPGRAQIVTGGDTPKETQVPYLGLDREDATGAAAVAWARQLAISGTVAQVPTGPEGIPPELWPASVAGAVASDGGTVANVLGNDGFSLSAGQAPETVPRKDTPEMISLRQACAEGVLKLGDRDPLGAARKAAQRDGFPEIAGRDGPTALYYRAELVEWQEGKIRVLRVVS